MNVKSGKTGLVSYSVVNLPSKSNQDSHTIHEDHCKEGLLNISSFGVFDGHLDVSNDNLNVGFS